MSTFTGKIIVAVFIAAACQHLSSAVIYQDDFESAVPGKAPASWRTVWGTQGSDIFNVSGEKSVSGNNSLQYERRDSNTPWQSAIVFPRIQEGTAVIAFKFMLNGQKSDAQYRLILRRNNVNIVDLRLSEETVSVKVFKEQLSLGELPVEPDKWYHLELSFPVGTADGQEFKITMSNPADGKKQNLSASWQATGEASTYLLICDFSGKVKNTSLFFDDFKIETISHGKKLTVSE